jgi:hypothetical protein
MTARKVSAAVCAAALLWLTGCGSLRYYAPELSDSDVRSFDFSFFDPAIPLKEHCLLFTYSNPHYRDLSIEKFNGQSSFRNIVVLPPGKYELEFRYETLTTDKRQELYLFTALNPGGCYRPWTVTEKAFVSDGGPDFYLREKAIIRNANYVYGLVLPSQEAIGSYWAAAEAAYTKNKEAILERINKRNAQKGKTKE